MLMGEPPGLVPGGPGDRHDPHHCQNGRRPAAREWRLKSPQRAKMISEAELASAEHGEDGERVARRERGVQPAEGFDVDAVDHDDKVGLETVAFEDFAPALVRVAEEREGVADGPALADDEVALAAPEEVPEIGEELSFDRHRP